MPSTTNELILESNVRHIGSGGALLFINSDNSWSVGLNTNALVKVHFGAYKSITDGTFGYSAESIEKASSGNGYTLYLRSDADNSQIVQVAVDATGNVDGASIQVLTNEQKYQAEISTGVDLDGSGGLGGAPVLIEGGSENLYMSADGVYELGADAAHLQPITVGGQPLTNKTLPSGWEISKCLPTASGTEVIVKSGNSGVFAAQLDANGAYLGGTPLTQDQVIAKETALSIDINGSNDLPTPAGWTSALKNSFIKSAVDAATAANGKMDYAQLVTMMTGIIQAHKANGNAPLSSSEFTDLQTLAGHGKNLFAGASASATDYLAHTFSKLVNGSVANEFYTGGKETPVALGNLGANSSVGTLEKLVDKWLLGGDLPTPTAGGDTATGKASTTVAVYAKSGGALFVDGVSPADVTQGALGDCYMVASLVTVADVKPNAITSAVVDNGTNNGVHTWGIRFYDSTGQANWVTVNDMLPINSVADPRLAFGGNPTKDLNGEIWVALFEKAYAQVNMAKILPRAEKSGMDAYYAVEGGSGDPIPELLGGGKVNAYNYENYNWDTNPYVINNVVDRTNPAALAALQATVIKAMNDGKPIWIGSGATTKDPYGNTLLTSGHAFSAQDANKADPASTVANVYNPWGVQVLPTPPDNVGHLSPFPYTISELIGMPDVNIWIGV